MGRIRTCHGEAVAADVKEGSLDASWKAFSDAAEAELLAMGMHEARAAADGGDDANQYDALATGLACPGARSALPVQTLEPRNSRRTPTFQTVQERRVRRFARRAHKRETHRYARKQEREAKRGQASLFLFVSLFCDIGIVILRFLLLLLILLRLFLLIRIDLIIFIIIAIMICLLLRFCSSSSNCC